MSYGFAQGIGDFLGDFNDESSKIRTANDKKAADDAAVEQRALEHLANADDPDIRAAAVTSMLTPKKGSGGSPLSKWFGQQRDHPVYDQIHQLINGGHQPFMGAEDEAAAKTAGGVRGRLEGANAGYRNVAGTDLPEADIRRGALGALGAPPSKRMPLQFGNITTAEGQTIGGYFDPETGEYNDSDGNTLTGVAKFERSTGRAAGSGNPAGAGSTWVLQPDPANPGKFVKIHRDAYGKQVGEAVPAVGPNAPPDTPFQTPGGFQFANPRTHTITPAVNGPAVTKTEDPSVNFDSLRKVGADVEARAKGSVAHFGGLPPDDKEMAAARDREAKTAGYQSWADLQNQIAAAQRSIGSAVQGGQNAPPAGVGAAGAQAPPPAAPGAPARPRSTKPAETPLKGAPKKGAAAGAALPGKLDINAILAELDKLKDF